MSSTIGQVIESALTTALKSYVAATLSEGFAKVVIVEALLERGYTLLEGRNRRNMAWTFKREGGLLTVASTSLPPMPAGPNSPRRRSSPDIRISEPDRFTIEIQVRCRFGSQCIISSANLLDDFERVSSGRADLFVLVADRVLYDAARGEKKDRRGRKALDPSFFSVVLPDVSPLKDKQSSETSERGFHVRVIRVVSEEDRVIALVERSLKSKVGNGHGGNGHAKRGNTP